MDFMVTEIFRSIQGESSFAGLPCVFVRLAGCNLHCRYCDSRHALTGGEPMLWAELIPLSGELRRRGRHVTVETAGTLYLPVECDLMSISPKLSNSTPSPEHHPRWARRHERTRHAPDVMRRLVAGYAYQVKFVVDCPGDCEEVEAYLAGFPEIDRDRVMLMPEGSK